jgi:hypothetical protein
MTSRNPGLVPFVIVLSVAEFVICRISVIDGSRMVAEMKKRIRPSYLALDPFDKAQDQP